MKAAWLVHIHSFVAGRQAWMNAVVMSHWMEMRSSVAARTITIQTVDHMTTGAQVSKLSAPSVFLLPIAQKCALNFLTQASG